MVSDTSNFGKISIIIPVYNSLTTLISCVESVINQSYKNIEIILVDDGSTDGSSLLCDEFSSKYSNVIVFHKDNSGVSSSRNLGILNSTGNWICFVDSDDWIEKDFLKNFNLYNYDCGESTIFLQGYIHTYPDSNKNTNVFNKRGCFSLPRDNYSVFENTTLLNTGTVCSKLYSREILINHKILFNEKMRLNEDNCFFWEYLKYCKNIVNSETCLYHYMHLPNINYSKSYKSYDEYLYIMKFNKKTLNELYDHFKTIKDTQYWINYSQYVSRIWLHAYFSLFEQYSYSKRYIYTIIKEEILPIKSEFMFFSSNSFVKKIFKILFLFLLKWPIWLQLIIVNVLVRLGKKAKFIN